MSPLSAHASGALSRRRFLKTASLAAGAAVFGVPALLRAKNPNQKLNIAVIGAWGKGRSDTDCCAGENIVALCDVDSALCAGQLKKYPGAKFYQDFRRMFDAMHGEIDAVVVSTPDHFHAVAASAAMQLGKHVYCQKPLTQTIHEARYLRSLAAKTGLVTQMGNQGSAADGLRRAVECIRHGLIGQVREVHAWTDRPIWPQGIGRPEGSDPVPDTLNWDVWIGPAPMRPFKKHVYHAFNWRGWQDFGTGALGDMACHTVNMPFCALNLGQPTLVEAEIIGGMNRETYPAGSRIHFHFPARSAAGGRRETEIPRGAELLARRTAPELAPLVMHWYDGGQPDPKARHGHDSSNLPPRELTADIELLKGEVPVSASLLVGDKGIVFSPDSYGEDFFVKLTGESKYRHYTKHEAVAAIPQWLPRNPFKGSTDERHHLEWIHAIKNHRPEQCWSRFAVGAQLTEINLLGCVALRSGKKIEWDAANMRATNAPEAAPFIRREFRAGWQLA